MLKAAFNSENFSEKAWDGVAVLICKVIEAVSLPVFVVTWFWRHKSILNILKWVAILSLIITYYLGLATLIGIFSFAGRLAYAAIFMIAQFAFLFMFLSSTKNIEFVPGDKGLVNFKDDYFGGEYLVESVQEWVSLMTDNRDKLEAMGAEAITGIMLTGEPGTGKTLLAQCLATSTKAAFIGMSGTDFSAMFVGVGPMKVKNTSRKGKRWAKQHGACITPDTRILTDDLRWMPAGELKVGDGIIGIDEETSGGHKKRRLRVGYVEAALLDTDELVTVITEKGEITVTPDHPFLSHSARGLRGNLSWTKAQNLQVGQRIKHLVAPWECEDGNTWLAGFMDGESCLSYSGGGRKALEVNTVQVGGPALERVKEELTARGFDFSTYEMARTSLTRQDCYNIRVGRLQQAARLLGQVRPQRLLLKAQAFFREGPPALPQYTTAKVLGIEKKNPGLIIRLQTSIRTYIAEGFISHNCILFIDEADAVGGNRGGVKGDKDQPVQGGMAGGMFGGGGLGVLSTLLTEMDGTKDIPLRDEIQNKMRARFGIPAIDPGIVLWMGATNRPDALDPAFIRPGRIDKIIPVDRPDKESRMLIIEGYLRKVKHDETVDVDELATFTQGVTPAKISSAVQRGAARHAIFDGRDSLSMKDIEAALQEDMFGLANPIQGLAPEQEYQISVHEAGHAVASALLVPEERITNVSIIRRGSSVLGYMRKVEMEEVYAMPLRRMAASVQVAMAGHIATELILNEYWTGASNDIKNAQRMIYSLAMHGQFKKIPYKIGDPFEDKEILRAADDYFIMAGEATRALLAENRDFLLRVVDELMEHKELSSTEFYAISKDFIVEARDESK